MAATSCAVTENWNTAYPMAKSSIHSHYYCYRLASKVYVLLHSKRDSDNKNIIFAGTEYTKEHKFYFNDTKKQSRQFVKPLSYNDV